MARLARRTTALVVGVALALTACSGGDGPSDGPPDATDPTGAPTGTDGALTLAASVASFDLSVGEDQRLLVGVSTSDRSVVGGGTVEFRLAALGDSPPASGEVPLGDPVTATFLPVPGNAPDIEDGPTVIDGRGAGVYAATVDLPETGFYGLRVTATVDGQEVSADANFQVQPEPLVVGVGDPAPRTSQPLAGADGVDPSSIDSRAADGEEIPDPELHDVTVADALDAGRPLVVVVSTPVYCVSQFCGPITETIQELAGEYDGVAEFVHLEVWENFQDAQLNEAAASWIQTDAGGNEPWVFLVGADGLIQARWDNVLDVEELESLLDEL